MGFGDLHEALSFDRLHSNNSGLWGAHLWGAFKEYVSRVGKKRAEGLANQQCVFLSLKHAGFLNMEYRFDKIPRWRGLEHFSNVMMESFNDGSKHEAISKVSFFPLLE